MTTCKTYGITGKYKNLIPAPEAQVFLLAFEGKHETLKIEGKDKNGGF